MTPCFFSPYGKAERRRRKLALKAFLWPEENGCYYFQSDEQRNLHYAQTFVQYANIQKDVQKDWEIKEI